MPEATYTDFPHGLRCADCGGEIEWGDNYSERLEGIMGDEFAALTDEPVMEVTLVCLRCAKPKYVGTGEIEPILDGDLNPINREDDDAGI